MDDARPAAKKPYPSILNVALVSLLFIFLSLAGGLLLGGALGFARALVGRPLPPYLAASLESLLMLAVYLVIFSRFSKKSGIRMEQFWVESLPGRRAALAFIPLMLGSIFLCSEIDNALQYVLPPPLWFSALFDGFAMNEYLSVAIVSLVVIPALFEESLFRGFFLAALARRHGEGVSVFVTALLFGVVHLNPWQFLTAFLLGLVFGRVAWHTRSVVLPVVAHALNNLLCLLAMRYPARFAIPGFNTGRGAVRFQPLWLDLAALALFSAGVVLMSRAFAAGSGKAREPDGESGPAER